jgi:HSP20 family protein
MTGGKNMNALAKKDANQVETVTTPERIYVAPEVNIFELEHGYVLEADMPGVNKDHLEVTLENNSLTLIGERTDEVLPGTAVYQESRPVTYRRVFEVDPMIDTAKIRAQVNQGVLTLELPKADAVKPRKIAVE